jgi:hypothetical protein
VKFRLIVFFILAALVIASVITVILCPFWWMDPYYHVIYSMNKENGNNTINSIVEQTKIYNQSPDRITKIALVITQDFSDPWWPYQGKDRFCPKNSGPSYWWCSPYYGTPFYSIYGENVTFAYPYYVDKLGRVTVREPNDLSVSPEWIAYQKAGTCQQISVFFNETVNRSGFVSRVVTASGYDHVWTEIQINGAWRVFDIQQFGQVNGSGIENSCYWNADPKCYPKCINQTNISVYTLDLSNVSLGSDITSLYFPKND